MNCTSTTCIFAGLFLVYACATLTRGTTEAFVIETEPGGATARTSLGFMCEPTPCVIPKIKRNASFTVTIEKDGYKSATYNITNKRADGGGMVMAGNVILGGVIGGIVDASNPGFSPKSIDRHFRANRGGVTANCRNRNKG